MKIGLAAAEYLEFQNCTKYSAIKIAEISNPSRVVDLKGERWQLIQAFREMSFRSFKVTSAQNFWRVEA